MKIEIALSEMKHLRFYPTCKLISFMDYGRRHETPGSDREASIFSHSNRCSHISPFVPVL